MGGRLLTREGRACRVRGRGVGDVRGGQPNPHSVRESAYDALQETSPKILKDKAEYNGRATCVLHTRGVFHHACFVFGCLATPPVRRVVEARHLFFAREVT